MPRLTYLTGLALLLLAGAFLLTDWLTWRPGVTEANVRRIKAGMTLREVERLLGRPPDQSYGPGHDFPRPVHQWRGRPGMVLVAEHGGVVERVDWNPE